MVSSGLDCRVLGSLTLSCDGNPVPLGGDRSRRALAALVLAAPHGLRSDALVEAVWEGEPPQGAREALRVHVSRLRTALGPARDRLSNSGGTYAFELRPGELDADRFVALVEVGRRHLIESRAAEASAALGEALALWRGPVLGDLAEVSNLQPHAARLEEHRLEALELRIGADLELGRHGALVGELAGLCAEHPLRERLWAQRILALYRSGRQADALRAYQEVRTILTEELGIEPGRELQELELSVLGHEGQLASPLPETHPFPGVGAAEDDPALRLMLVDDHPVWRQAIKATVAHAGVARVVAEADDGDEAVRLATEVHPDVILMDLHLPGRPGTEATRAILGLNPGVRVLMLSSSDDDADVLEAIKAGASGYLLKSASAAEVTDAVLHAAAGQAVFSPAVANVVLRQARGDGGPGLDARQRQIMRLLADGMTYGRIAVQLGTTEADVRALVLAAVRTDDGQAEPTRALRTVTFLDIVGSTAIGVDLGDRRWAEVVRQYHDCTRGTVEAHGGVLVKTAGDGVMATFTNPTDAIIAAREAMDRARELDLVLRAGIHSGECEIVSDDLHGVAVNIAARVIDRASDDEILISQTVRDLALGAEIEFHDRGAHALRGVPGRWRLYAAAPA